jgi:hypothetical protein
MGDMSQDVLDSPGILRFRARDEPFPFFSRDFGNKLVKELKLLDGALDNFFTGMVHGFSSLLLASSSGARFCDNYIYTILFTARAGTV